MTLNRISRDLTEMNKLEGWLTAEDVVNRIEEMVMGDNNENGTM